MNSKMKIYITIIFLISFVIPSMVMAQSTFETSKMREVLHPHTNNIEYSSAKNNTNEVEYIFSGLFLFYKAFISSQDGQSCSFTPSCSEFGMQAVKKQGPILGVINTIDRLTRCNGLSPEKYNRDDKSKLLHDPL